VLPFVSCFSCSFISPPEEQTSKNNLNHRWSAPTIHLFSFTTTECVSVCIWVVSFTNDMTQCTKPRFSSAKGSTVYGIILLNSAHRNST
jgi:hypothetical protein